MLICENSDASLAKPGNIFPSRRSLRLTSEFKPPAPVALSFSLSPVVRSIFDAWFEELYLKLCKDNSPKLKAFFKSNASKAALRPYQSRDGEFPSEAAANAPLYYSWLPNPDRSYDMAEKDVISIETTSRSSVRILNFMELSLQAFHNLRDDPGQVDEIVMQLSRAVKAALQIQIGLVCNMVLFRRDHFLASARGLSKDQVIC